ncbi:MAG: hypothetical protein HC809_12980, partial [Gammaproteobacteria bacterium]|nr:hypothetical protein [Gammaproteobacteria bacterium]
TGYTRIVAEFMFDADMVQALDTVKQRVANIRNLPADIEPPIVRRIVDLEPISSVLVTGAGDVSELIPLVRDMEKDLLARGVTGCHLRRPAGRRDRAADQRPHARDPRAHPR